jgi:hypothetical protein
VADDGIPDATARIANITGVAWHYVNVCLEYGLTRSCSGVETHVESVGVAIAQESTHPLNERPERSCTVDGSDKPSR